MLPHKCGILSRDPRGRGQGYSPGGITNINNNRIERINSYIAAHLSTGDRTAVVSSEEHGECQACGTLPSAWRRNAREIQRTLRHPNSGTNLSSHKRCSSTGWSRKPFKPGTLIAALQGVDCGALSSRSMEWYMRQWPCLFR